MLKLISGILIILFFSGCTHLLSVSTSSIPKNRDRKVNVTVERFIFMAFNFNNNYVNDLAEQLAQKCPDGKVKGILTKHEKVGYFLAHTVRVSAEGYCVKHKRRRKRI